MSDSFAPSRWRAKLRPSFEASPSSSAFAFAVHAVMLDAGFAGAGCVALQPNSAPLPEDWAQDNAAYAFHYTHQRACPPDAAFVLKVLVAGDAASVAASQLPDGACKMIQLQISHFVRLDAHGAAEYSQEEALTRAIASNICHSLVPALKPPPPPPAALEPGPFQPCRHAPQQAPGYPFAPPAGGASDLYPSGPGFLPDQSGGFGQGGMLIGHRNFPHPYRDPSAPHFGIPAPVAGGPGMPRFDPYFPPDLQMRPQMPRNYGDAFAPPQSSSDIFCPPGFIMPGGMGMRPPSANGGGRGGGSLGPFGGGRFL